MVWFIKHLCFFIAALAWTLFGSDAMNMYSAYKGIPPKGFSAITSVL